MGLGLVNAPRAESVPARNVFATPSAGNLKNREIGSTCPCLVSRKRRLDISVCSVLALDVRRFGSHTRGYPNFQASLPMPRKGSAYLLGVPS